MKGVGHKAQGARHKGEIVASPSTSSGQVVSSQEASLGHGAWGGNFELRIYRVGIPPYALRLVPCALCRYFSI